MNVLLSLNLDVEEEGLFRGVYGRTCTSRNTARLDGIRPLLDAGMRATFFCAHSVLADDESRERLARWHGEGVEIAAHLHHWNTPPLPDGAPEERRSVPAAAVPAAALEEKIRSVARLCREISGTPPRSFRMGRWDAHGGLWPILARAGFSVDASVRPLHGMRFDATGLAMSPDHFDAPLSPYRIVTPCGSLLEVPLTVAPLLPGLPAVIRALPAGPGRMLRASLPWWGVLALLPVQHPLALMKAATLAMLDSGVRVFSLTWHSSEMAPGCAPHMPDERAVKNLLQKALRWHEWLRGRADVRCVRMDELPALLPDAPEVRGNGDWTCAFA